MLLSKSRQFVCSKCSIQKFGKCLQDVCIKCRIHVKKEEKKNISFINSNTAKNGYREEELVCNDLNNNNELKRLVVDFLEKDYQSFSRVNGNNKCDIQSFDSSIKIQVKKYKNGQFQQLDRHWINNIVQYIPDLIKVSLMLKNLCEYPILSDGIHIDKTVPVKKLCLSNYSNCMLDNFIDIFNKNKKEILNYAFLGTSQEMKPNYLCGVEYCDDDRKRIVLFKIKDILSYLNTLDFKLAKSETVIILGDDSIISLQRKGGDGGKKSSNQLQIKIIVSKLLDKVANIQYTLV